MANTIGDSNLGIGHFQELREQRQVARDARVSEASEGLAAQRLDAGTIAEHQGFFNGVLDDTARIKGGLIGGGLLGGIFLVLDDDRKINDATKPDFRDNDKASEIKSEYREAHQEIKRETAQASRIAQKLGPGTHEMSNGDRVTVTVDPETGRQTVKTTRPDGSTKEVTLGDGASVRKTWPDGRETELTQHGTTVSRHERDAFGQETDTRFRLDPHGRVVRDKTGPADDDEEHTVVNEDGSTDTRTFVYEDEHGRKVYAKEHEHGRGLCPPFPHPEPTPLPFPRPQPLPFPQPWDEKPPSPLPWDPPKPLPMPGPFDNLPRPKLPIVELGGSGHEGIGPVTPPAFPETPSPAPVPLPEPPGRGHVVTLPDGTEIELPDFDVDHWKKQRRLPDAIPFRGQASAE